MPDMTSSDLPRWRRLVLQHVPAPVLREPFALWLAFVCVLTAGLHFAGFGTRPLAAQLLPDLFFHAWNAELALGGILTLAGILANRPRVLILGLQPLGMAALAYAIGLLYVAGSRAIFSSAIVAAFALACFLKAFVYSTAHRPEGGLSP